MIEDQAEEAVTGLDFWQARLAEHFARLRAARQAAGGDRPIFALEHGLEAAEVQAVAAALRAHIARAAPSMDHALPWIIYAAEIGYGYSGDEYWQSEHKRNKDAIRLSLVSLPCCTGIKPFEVPGTMRVQFGLPQSPCGS